MSKNFICSRCGSVLIKQDPSEYPEEDPYDRYSCYNHKNYTLSVNPVDQSLEMESFYSNKYFVVHSFIVGLFEISSNESYSTLYQNDWSCSDFDMNDKSQNPTMMYSDEEVENFFLMR